MPILYNLIPILYRLMPILYKRFDGLQTNGFGDWTRDETLPKRDIPWVRVSARSMRLPRRFTRGYVPEGPGEDARISAVLSAIGCRPAAVRFLFKAGKD